MLLIWFQLWAPLFSVANYLMISVDANPMNRIASEFGGSTLLAAGIIREAGATSQAIAGSIMLLIPVIAFALAKGSDMAFVSMANGLMAPAQGASFRRLRSSVSRKLQFRERLYGKYIHELGFRK